MSFHTVLNQPSTAILELWVYHGILNFIDSSTVIHGGLIRKHVLARLASRDFLAENQRYFILEKKENYLGKVFTWHVQTTGYS